MSILSLGLQYTGPVPGSANMTQRQFNDLVRQNVDRSRPLLA